MYYKVLSIRFYSTLAIIIMSEKLKGDEEQRGLPMRKSLVSTSRSFGRAIIQV